jgi:BirA family biotin operon repressor/biotin-[acetyl-CoA-carboxylase] ligase
MIDIGQNVILLSEVTSTSNYAAELLVKRELTEGTAILAYSQTKGKGQRGRKWDMIPGEDLAVSFVLYPEVKDSESFIFNKAMTLGVFDTVQHILGKGVAIKWPNDIYFKEGKISGILVELTWSGMNVKHAIVGIGFNISKRSFSEVDSRESIGKYIDSVRKEKVFDLLCEKLNHWYAEYRMGEKELIEKEFNARLFKRNQKVIASSEEGMVSGILDSVNSVGSLVLDVDGKKLSLPYGVYRLEKS